MPTPRASAADAYARWEGEVEFRLFTDLPDPTLSVPEQIAAKVGDRVIVGRLAPGSRIGEQELADEFKVSRGPVREAIRLLEREGLVTVLPRRGALVTQLSSDELRELYEVRSSLIELVLRKVATARPSELLDILRAGVDRLEALADQPGAGDAYAETVYRLILITARFAGNERLRRLLNAISLQTLRYSKLGLAAVERRRRSARMWRKSCKALEQGDVAQLIELSRQRSTDSADEASRQLEAGPSPA
jgi:DNA-binding GntR family transcriptional regulator